MLEPALTLLPFGILFGAELARLFAPRQLPRGVLAYGALALIALCALVADVMAPVALAVAVMLFLTAAGAAGQLSANQADWARAVSTAGLLLVAATLMLHVAPGFDNPVIDRNLQLSPQSTTFDVY